MSDRWQEPGWWDDTPTDRQETGDTVMADTMVEEPPKQVHLPKSFTDLRDGLAPPPASQGMARIKRLTQLQRDINALIEFHADLGRYIEHAQTAPLTGTEVGPYMDQLLKTLRAQIDTKGQELQAELTYLQDHP